MCWVLKSLVIFADSQDSLNFGVQNDMRAYGQQYHVSELKRNVFCNVMVYASVVLQLSCISTKMDYFVFTFWSCLELKGH